MGYYVEGPWTSPDGLNWYCEVSDLFGPRLEYVDSTLPSTNVFVSCADWINYHDEDGDLTHMVAVCDEYIYTIYND